VLTMISERHIHSLDRTTGLNMQTTLVGQTKNSNMQEMGETREPMAYDCWTAAQEIAEKYAGVFNRDFWIMYAAKPDVVVKNQIRAAWEVVIKRPINCIVGVLVFHWDNNKKRLLVDTVRSLPYDIPIQEDEMSKDARDYIPTLEKAARESGSILLA